MAGRFFRPNQRTHDGVEREESRSRYADLHDFAPLGYAVLDHQGRICSANLTGAGFLGEALISRLFRINAKVTMGQDVKYCLN